eukprot:TRINITY_DN2153_c0_g1_i1.p1 TRINITY_DN2153_c0_g1~~TRINITY_DN2153_c0_g1_i1.p1  ORF type:complete len:352 (-),score=85.79 TRINITY_DN2153_c0_g1_i1:158-1213(-)
MKSFSIFSSILIVSTLLFHSIEASPSCLDESGNPVDWWVLIKAPKDTDYDDASDSGYGYSYADTNSQTVRWTGKRLDKVPGALEKTLGQIYDDDSLGRVLYNDEDPSSSNHESFGHTKGVMGFDGKSGFWLVHSVPQYPPVVSDGYSYREGGSLKGQSFLCVSMSNRDLDRSASAFLLNKPFIYDSNLPDRLASTMVNINSALNADWADGSRTSNFTISSLGGSQFMVFAKNKASEVALWDDVVGPSLASGIYVETWMDGAETNKMKSKCPPKVDYKTLNVKTVSLKSGLSYDETKDHSKWAVTIDRPGIFCIGDINRQKSQSKRGGGAVCAKITPVAKSFLTFVSDYQKC